MTAPLLHLARRNAWVAVVSLPLVAVAAWPWFAPPGTPVTSATVPENSAPVRAPEDLPALATFSAVFERPLFSPSRRPVPEAKPAEPAAGAAARYKLLGLVTVGDTRRAVLADGARHFHVAEGASFEGWTVARIALDHVLLSSASEQKILRLRRPRSTDSSQPAVIGR